MNKFVRAVDRMLDDEALWTKYSETAKQRARALYTWDNVADRFEAVMNSPPAPRAGSKAAER